MSSTAERSLSTASLRVHVEPDATGYAIDARVGDGWQRVGRGTFGKLVTVDASGARQETAIRLPDARADASRLHLSGRWVDDEGLEWQLSHELSVTDDPHQLRIVASAVPSADAKVLHFSGPTILAGDGSFGAGKTDGLFPGLEYLGVDEPSSSTAFASSTHATRTVPHPYKITVPLMAVSSDGLAVGLTWDPNQAYGSAWRHPAAVFSSPNAVEGGDNHLLGLFAPGVPRFTEENSREASRPFGARPADPITIEARLVVLTEASSLAVLRSWVDSHGLPAIDQPHTFAENVDLCVRSYLDVAWDDDAEGWHHTLADPWGPRYEARLIAQLWRYSQWPNADPGLRQRARDQVERGLARAVSNSVDGTLAPHLELALHRGQVPASLAAMKRSVAALIAAQQDDGSWPWQPSLIAHPTLDTEERRTVMGGEDSSTGLTAERGLQLLRWALITGDTDTGDAALRAVEWCNAQSRPEGAQTWELHLHVPDVLAVPYLIDINLLAHRLTGDPAFLDQADRWAWTGLPFTWLWRALYRPIMAYGTVPVFGVTFHDVQSWFGVDVHWNGLVYADALFRLVDATRDERWRELALGIVACGMRQQQPDGPWKGMYPDAMSIVRGDEEYTWWLNPNLIGLNTFELAGIPLDISSMSVPMSDGRVARVTSAATVAATRQESARLEMELDYPRGESSHTIVGGIRTPAAVTRDGAPLPEVDDLDTVEQGWHWLADAGLLLVKVPHTGAAAKVGIALAGTGA